MRSAKSVEERHEAVVFLKMSKSSRRRVGRPTLGETRDGRTMTTRLANPTRLEEKGKERGPMIVDLR